MTQKSGNAIEVSAYLDGKLSPRDLVAFESRMAQDPALRRHVEETRQVVALMRAMPLRETPRNYLITPAMVAETGAASRPAPRRTPLLVMRLTTSLAALAFVIMSGWVLLQRGTTPAMVTRPNAAPQAEMMQEYVVATAEAEAEMATSEDIAAAAAGAAVADATGTGAAEEGITTLKAAEPGPQGTPAPEEERALAPMPPAEESADAGIGGGEPAVEATTTLAEAAGMGPGDEPVAEVPAPEAPAASRIAATAPAADAEEQVFALAEEAPVDVEIVDAPASAGASAPALDTGETVSERAATDPDRTATSPLQQLVPSMWLAIGLGLATVLLAAITFWLSRCHRD